MTDGGRHVNEWLLEIPAIFLLLFLVDDRKLVKLHVLEDHKS